MDLLPTAEQEEIVASVRSVLTDRSVIGEPTTDELWNAAAEQGWFALGLSEDDGGIGYSIVEEALLFKELGRHAVPGPFLAGVIATQAAALQRSEELASFASGAAKVALAIDFDSERLVVADLDSATHVLVVSEAGVGLGDATGLTEHATQIPSLDTLVPLTLVSRSAVATQPIGESAALLQRGSLLVSAMLAGIAEATTAQSVAYGMDREQFGQPIGGFQAVKHRCADMATRAEVASCQVAFASLTLRDGLADADFQIAAARIVAAQAAITNSQINVQNHGGIGFTWEHTAHRFVTRSRVLSHWFGTTATAQAAVVSA
jgi:alkylation response protein AidB-like acyl-CoA dehydrogenase